MDARFKEQVIEIINLLPKQEKPPNFGGFQVLFLSSPEIAIRKKVSL